jgi:hypothetical protein
VFSFELRQNVAFLCATVYVWSLIFVNYNSFNVSSHSLFLKLHLYWRRFIVLMLSTGYWVMFYNYLHLNTLIKQPYLSYCLKSRGKCWHCYSLCRRLYSCQPTPSCIKQPVEKRHYHPDLQGILCPIMLHKCLCCFANTTENFTPDFRRVGSSLACEY